MATPKMQRPQPLNDARTTEPALPGDDGPERVISTGDTWWQEFVEVEKVFSIISWLVIFGALAAYLGRWIGIYPITIIGIVVFSVGLVGLASLTYPIARIGVKAVSEWRRQRSAERAGEV